ncbi:hypothetical protein HRbin34_00098 [bacterium HR34]|nr:hypothetical protein HRbin34_00098 [bacterium HR34]
MKHHIFIISGFTLIIYPIFFLLFNLENIFPEKFDHKKTEKLDYLSKKTKKAPDGIDYNLNYFLKDYLQPKKSSYNTNLFLASVGIVPAKVQKPEFVKGVYLTSYLAANRNVVANVINSAKSGKINAVVIDVKDHTGYLSYNSNLPIVEEYKTEYVIIPDIKGLVDLLHKNNIYVIARMPVFQDYALSLARPDLALHDENALSLYKPFQNYYSVFTLWKDRKGLHWLDPSSKEVWEYNLQIAQELTQIGFDEINFDYIRFPSDGDLEKLHFPVWDYKKKKEEVVREFFQFLNGNLRGKIYISADLFGLTTVSYDDMGIGQVIEYGFENFDFVCPMIYPSHYAKNFMGFENPAEHPYEVVKNSMDSAFQRLKNGNYESKLRPWLQDFNLCAVYDKNLVQDEIRAVLDSAKGREDLLDGWLLWDPSGYYSI